MARRWWTLVAVSTGVFMLLLDLTIVNVALPDIQRAFGATLSDLQWTIDAYALTLAAFLLTAGALADRLGRRRLFASGLAVFTAGSLACGLATGPLSLIFARAGQGVGGAIMFATSLALIAQAFQGRDRAIAFGLLGAITGVAVAVGPVVGGLLTSGLSWRWIFFVNLPIGIVALLVTLRMVDESRNPFAKRLDVVGFATFSSGLAALTFGLIRSAPDGWGSATVDRVAGRRGRPAHGLRHRRAGPARTRCSTSRCCASRRSTAGCIAALGVNGSLFSLLTYLILYFQQTLGLSAAQTGVRFLPLTGAIFVASGIAGRLSERVPIRALIGPGFALIGGGLLLMRGVDATSAWTHFLPGMIVAGIGAGLGQRPARRDRDRRRRARARRHGLGHQHDVPAGRDGDGRRGARLDPRRPRRPRRRPERDPARRRRDRVRRRPRLDHAHPRARLRRAGRGRAGGDARARGDPGLSRRAIRGSAGPAGSARSR